MPVIASAVARPDLCSLADEQACVPASWPGSELQSPWGRNEMECLKLQSRRQDETTGLICHSVDIVKRCLEHSSLPNGKTSPGLPIAAAVKCRIVLPFNPS